MSKIGIHCPYLGLLSTNKARHMNLYTPPMATNLAVTSMSYTANTVLEPKQSGRLRRDKKHKDGVEVSISRGSTNQIHEELLNMLKGQFG